MRLRKIIIELSNHHYIAFLPVLLAVLLFGFYTIQIIRGRLTGKWFWLAATIFIFFTHSSDFFQEVPLNPDEEQWLICANSIIHSPSTWLNSFALFDYTRLFTILPLLFLSIFHNFLSYDDARLINLILFLLFILLQFKIVKFSFNKETAFFTCSLLLIFFAISFAWDFISYNSEMPTIVLISLAFYLFIRETKNLGSKPALFLTGLLTSFLYFSKEQALPLSAFLVLVITFHFLKNKNYSRLGLYYLGGIAGLSFIYIPLLTIYGPGEVVWVFTNSIEYAQNGLSMNTVQTDKNYLDDLINLILLNKEYFVISTLAFTSIAIQLFFLSDKSRKKQIGFFDIVFILLAFVTIYTIYLPKNFFFHYTIFLLVPFSWLISWLYRNFIKEQKKIIIISSIFTVLLVSKIYDNQLRLFYPLSEFISPVKFPQEDIIYKLIRKNANQGDGMMIWGWGNTYYVTTELQRSSGFLYPQFATGYFSGKKHAAEVYIKNVREQKPKIIIELAGKDRFFFEDKKKYSIENNSPQLMELIDQDYETVDEDSNYVFYRRK